MASHPSTALPIPPPTSSASRSTTTGSAPSASTSPVCSSLRTSPLTSWPSSASILTRRLAVLPCAPATKTITKTTSFESGSTSRLARSSLRLSLLSTPPCRRLVSTLQPSAVARQHFSFSYSGLAVQRRGTAAYGGRFYACEVAPRRLAEMLRSRRPQGGGGLTNEGASLSVLKCSHGDAVAEADGEAVGDAVGPVVSRGVVLGAVAGDVLGCGPTGAVGAS